MATGAGEAWPSFSIVIPTHQRREVVSEAVQALARLRYTGKLELIVVVDGSTDGTAEALVAIACPFPVRIVGQPNAGASSARNRGAADAENDVILFLDDDMIAEPNLIEEHARAYREGADAVIGGVQIDRQSNQGFLPDSVARWLASSPVQSPIRPFDVFTGQLSVRRSVFEKVGGFDPELTTGAAFGNEDADFGVRLLASRDVRHNPAARTSQRYVVTPREYMRRAPYAAAADLRFAHKHPELARQLFQLKGVDRPLTRLLYRPLSRLPLVPQLLAATSVGLAELAMRTPLRSNRALARFFSGSRAVAYWAALRARGWSRDAGRVLVLCYHAIEERTDDPVIGAYSVPPSRFAQQLDSLVARGYSFITPDEFAGFLLAGEPVPRRAVLLSFDDGYAELSDVARDILRQRGIKALIFSVSGFGANEWDRPHGAGPRQLLDDKALRELAADGHEIGSHSRTHRLMLSLDADEIRLETTGSADDFVSRGLPRPRCFAYPYGARDAACVEAVAEAGFAAAFGPRQARLRRSSPRFDLPRVQIHAADCGWRFRLKTAAPATSALLSRAGEAVSKRLARLTRATSRGA